MGKVLRTIPLPVTALILSFLCPTELSLFLGSLRLPPHRIVLLIVVPIALWKLIGNGNCRFKAFDFFFLAFGAWVLFAFSLHPGETGGIETGGSEALDSVGGYLVARAYIRTIGHFVAVLQMMAVAVIVSGLIALPEMITGRHYVHELMQAITGQTLPLRGGMRFGLTRAYASFDHPIHLGTFCSAMFALFWYAAGSWTSRLTRGGLIVLATFTAVSSAPILGLLLQGGMIIWDMLTRAFRGRVMITVSLVVVGLMTISFMSSRSVFALIAAYMTFNPWTGYYRLLIWEHGMANIAAHPWIGLGLGEWARPEWMVSDSVDAFWLLIGLRTGLPTIIFLLTAIALLVYSAAKVARRHPDWLVKRYAKAWFISLIAFVLVGCTVHFWNVLACYFFFFLGLAGWIADPVRVRQPVASAQTTSQRKRGRRRRRRARPAQDMRPGTLQPA